MRYRLSGSKRRVRRLRFAGLREKVQVGLLCIDASGNPYTRFGPWVIQSGQRSLKYCDLTAHRLDALLPDVVIETR